MIPGPGTTAEVSAALGDLALLTAVQIELVLLIAYLYDRPLADHEARRLDVLMALGVDAGVVKLGRGAAAIKLAGEKIPVFEFDAGSIDLLAARANRKLATQVASRLAAAAPTSSSAARSRCSASASPAVYNGWSTRYHRARRHSLLEHIS